MARLSHALLVLMLTGSYALGAAPALFEVTDATGLRAAVGAIPPRAGATIRLAPGAYPIREPLIFQDAYHVNLHGSGWNTTIVKQGPGDALVFESCQFCVLRDLHVAGHPDNGTGSGIVYRAYSSSNTIESCRIENFPGSGVRYEGGPDKPMSTNSLRFCHLIANRGDQLWCRHNNDFYILGNQFGSHWTGGGYAPSRSGAVLDHASAGSYSLNYHWGNVVALRLQGGSHFNRFENNRFEESRQSGIVIGDASGDGPTWFNLFTGNTIHTNSQEEPGRHPAVLAYDASKVTFTDNQVFSWNSEAYRHRAGLELARGCRDWIVKDNLFSHHTGPAVVFDASTGHLVKDNLAE